MKEKFQREDIIFCSSLIQEGFLQVGYQNEKDRINALAKGLLKNWKEKWPGWDKNDLQKHFTGYVESGLGKIVLPELVSAFNEKYKFAKPKLKPTATIDRTQIEKDYIKDIIRRVEEEDYFSENTHWREFSLFHIPMELCREFIPEECFKEFERLKGELKERDSSFCVVSVFKKRGFESRDNMREKQELIKLL